MGRNLQLQPTCNACCRHQVDSVESTNCVDVILHKQIGQLTSMMLSCRFLCRFVAAFLPFMRVFSLFFRCASRLATSLARLASSARSFCTSRGTLVTCTALGLLRGWRICWEWSTQWCYSTASNSCCCDRTAASAAATAQQPKSHVQVLIVPLLLHVCCDHAVNEAQACAGLQQFKHTIPILEGSIMIVSG
jgi:hypothetical protein